MPAAIHAGVVYEGDRIVTTVLFGSTEKSRYQLNISLIPSGNRIKLYHNFPRPRFGYNGVETSGWFVSTILNRILNIGAIMLKMRLTEYTHEDAGTIERHIRCILSTRGYRREGYVALRHGDGEDIRQKEEDR